MCGIFGGVFAESSPLRALGPLQACAERLFLLSESRGKEAAGIAVASAGELSVYKAAVPARTMLRTRGYKQQLRKAAGTGEGGIAFIGHSRLVTDGGRELNRNNQPVIADGIVGVHNGIIVNHAALWRQHAQLSRKLEVDSEVIFALLREQLSTGVSLEAAARAVFGELEGNASIACLFAERDQLLLATNNGSLYFRSSPAGAGFIFGSESYILDQFAERHVSEFGHCPTEHLRAGQAALVDLLSLEVRRLELRPSPAPGQPPAPSGVASGSERTSARAPRQLIDAAQPDPPPPRPPRAAQPLDMPALAARFPYVSMRDKLRRCSRCVLPETMPFIEFDAQGVCIYCRTRGPLSVHGHAALEALVAPHRRSDGKPDCIVGVSGGRDSIFGLHYLKHVLGLNPVAYTYDWGMVTDLARRNTSRICGKLGIEHILVSADIPRKRAYIRANVEAWLERPALGTIPLFMAGDKAYFHHLNQVRQQLGVELAFLCENPLERTDFKTGFAGVSPIVHDADHSYTLPVRHKLQLAAYYARQFLEHPAYLNRSLLDTAQAFAFYYVTKRDYHNLYRYVQWDEEEVARTLLGQYDFERAPDTESLWRIGDGTAAFYNYIYHAVAGMTENDTFRSNQIRQGVITREAALQLVERDNRPRFASIQWYLATIGLERSVAEVLELIESAAKRPGMPQQR
ncbi:MAG: hypothetical protein RL033_7663 [Pseudomonadota bacterium]